MTFDYWHQERFFRLAGATDDDPLTFGSPPFVVGPVVTMREPIWQSARATLTANGAPTEFDSWNWANPLEPGTAGHLVKAITLLTKGPAAVGSVHYADNLSPADRPDPETVVAALDALGELLRESVARDLSVETWVT